MKPTHWMWICLACLLLLVACGRQTAPTAAPSSTSNLQAAVDASVAATNTAQAALTPQPSQPAVEGTPVTTPAADYAALTEEELTASIDQAVTDAADAATTASSAAASAAADDTITSDEVVTLI